MKILVSLNFLISPELFSKNKNNRSILILFAWIQYWNLIQMKNSFFRRQLHISEINRILTQFCANIEKLCQIIIDIQKVRMRTDNYDYLSKSSVGPSSMTFKKSPNKYGYSESRPEEIPYMQKSMTSPSRKEWSANDYTGVRKVSQDFRDMRNTFDARTNAKLQQALYKANNSTNDDLNFVSSKQQNFSKTQSYMKSPSNGLESSAVYQRTYKNSDPISSYTNKYDKNVKSPNTEKKMDIDQKYRQYADAVQKFKQHVQTTSKMSEELKRLKQDRKKRLQAKEKEAKQKQVLITKQTKDSFKKKISTDFYSPKDEKDKNNYRQKLNQKNSNPTPTLNLDKYKNYLKTQSYTTTLNEPKSATVQSKTSTLSSPLKTKSQSIYNGEIRDFTLGKLLGEGKFGTVYQGFNKKTGSIYAIKKIPKDMIKSHLMIDQFCLQIKLQTFLNHENILTLFNFFDDKTSIYLVLQYMQEGTLFSHLKKNKTLPESEVAIKIRQIASAIKYLHENQIAHRDIKPENIVMSHGVCKLCDFGWATVCDQRRKTYCGTFDYAPPEILQGSEYDYTVDLWCLGVLTYQLLVGKAPFYHISRKQTMKKILNVEKTNIEYPDFLSKNAVSFIQNLIRKNPKQRLSSEEILQHPFLANAFVKMDLGKKF